MGDCFTAAVARVTRARGSKAVIGKFPHHASSTVYPEPGEWVYDRPKGMKPISRPEPIPEGMIDNEEVRHYVRYDGLGHCIWSLIPEEKLKDEQLRRKWYKVRNAMQAVLEHLENHK